MEVDRHEDKHKHRKIKQSLVKLATTKVTLTPLEDLVKNVSLHDTYLKVVDFTSRQKFALALFQSLLTNLKDYKKPHDVFFSLTIGRLIEYLDKHSGKSKALIRKELNIGVKEQTRCLMFFKASEKFPRIVYLYEYLTSTQLLSTPSIKIITQLIEENKFLKRYYTKDPTK